jgi:hypothetical protein
MGASIPTGVPPSKSGSKGYQYILVVGAFSAFFFGKLELHPELHAKAMEDMK